MRFPAGLELAGFSCLDAWEKSMGMDLRGAMDRF
jgi:hypothetical protein